MKKLQGLFLTLCTSFSLLVPSTNLSASENDVFSGRYYHLEKMSDASEVVNQEINKYIALGVEKANRVGSEKKRVKLITITESLRDFLGRHFRWQISGTNPKKPWTYFRLLANGDMYKHNNIYRSLKYEADIDRAKVCVEDSVYRDFDPKDSRSLKTASKFHDTMAKLFKIEGLLIGSDKFSHFFNRGVKYFKRRYGLKWSKDLDDDEREKYTMAAGEHSENSSYGVKSTGIASFADLMANFQGMRFWNDVLGVGPDVVTKKWPAKPMVVLKEYMVKARAFTSRKNEERVLLEDLTPKEIEKLKKRRWKVMKFWVKVHDNIDIRDYVNVAWDEGYNCSKFRNVTMATSTKKRVDEVSNAVSTEIMDNAYHRKGCENIRKASAGADRAMETIPAKYAGQPEKYHCPIDLPEMRKLKEVFGEKYYAALVNEKGYDFFKEGELKEGGFLASLLFDKEPSADDFDKFLELTTQGEKSADNVQLHFLE